jgi:hypothetical protein
MSNVAAGTGDNPSATWPWLAEEEGESSTEEGSLARNEEALILAGDGEARIWEVS